MQISGMPTSISNSAVAQSSWLGAAGRIGLETSDGSGKELSSVAAFCLEAGFTEVSFEGSKTVLAYRSDSSLKMSAKLNMSVSLSQTKLEMDLTIPAEAFGEDYFKPQDFSKGPIIFSFSYAVNSVQIEKRIKSSEVKPLRKVEEVLQDIQSALGEVLRQKGNKTVALVLDEEAIKVLFSDPKVQKLMGELAALIGMANSLSVAKGGQRDLYAIQVSGKGKPYLDYQQDVSVHSDSQQIGLRLVITPPQEASDDADQGEQKEE
mgnify:FL=1